MDKEIIFPTEIWLKIFSYIIEYKPVLNLVCHDFKDILTLDKTSLEVKVENMIKTKNIDLIFSYILYLKHDILYFIFKSIELKNLKIYKKIIKNTSFDLEENEIFFQEQIYSKNKIFKVKVNTLFYFLIINKLFDYLEILCKQGCFKLHKKIFIYAIENNDISLINFCREFGILIIQACNLAAIMSNVDTMNTLINLGFIYDEETLEISDENSNIEVYNLLVEKLNDI